MPFPSLLILFMRRPGSSAHLVMLSSGCTSGDRVGTLGLPAHRCSPECGAILSWGTQILVLVLAEQALWCSCVLTRAVLLDLRACMFIVGWDGTHSLYLPCGWWSPVLPRIRQNCQVSYSRVAKIVLSICGPLVIWTGDGMLEGRCCKPCAILLGLN